MGHRFPVVLITRNLMMMMMMMTDRTYSAQFKLTVYQFDLHNTLLDTAVI